MKAIRIHACGGAEAFAAEDIPVPAPGPGEALVRIEAAGLNYIDTYHRTGLYPVSLPATLGVEAAGVVHAVGPGATGVRVGDRVAYCPVLGAYAEHAVVPVETLVPVPEGISTELAAAAVLQGMTAHYLAFDTCSLKPGDTALVHAAAGGTGSLLVQMAKRTGATVIGTVGTDAKAEVARDAGADEVIVYTRVDFENAVQRITEAQGVNVVYDSVGRATFERSLNCLRPRGLLVLYGQSSGPVPPVDLQILNRSGSLFVTRPSLGHYVASRGELLRRAGDVFTWLAAGELKVRIDRTMPLDQAAEAHRLLESRQTAGKVVLIP